MGNGNRIWLLFTIFALRQELFDRNLPHIAEFVTVSKSLPRFLRNAYKYLIFNIFLFQYRFLRQNRTLDGPMIDWYEINEAC